MPSRAHRICLVCHSPVTTNSGRHAYALAGELQQMGWHTTLCVPSRENSDAPFASKITVRTFEEYLSEPYDLARTIFHYWTPRERLRSFHTTLCEAAADQKPTYLIHFEDDEEILLNDQIKLPQNKASEPHLQVPAHLTHPVLGRRFAQEANGLTALTATLLEEFTGLPSAVFWPGYDAIFEQPAARDALHALRRELGISDQTYIVTYIGNMHFSNADEVRSLYIAVALTNRMGLPLTLIRTGQDAVPLAEHGEELLRKHVRELGHVAKSRLPLLLQLADILVQPGRDDQWNRRRVPSKLPEFLISGRPVILPKANLGTVLQHGESAIILDHATASSIAEALVQWLPHAEARRRIGRRGRQFALEHLQWRKAAEKVDRLYAQVLERPRRSQAATKVS